MFTVKYVEIEINSVGIEALKHFPLGIPKGDQLDRIGLHLSEMFAKGRSKVGFQFYKLIDLSIH